MALNTVVDEDVVVDDVNDDVVVDVLVVLVIDMTTFVAVDAAAVVEFEIVVDASALP